MDKVELVKNMLICVYGFFRSFDLRKMFLAQSGRKCDVGNNIIDPVFVTPLYRGRSKSEDRLINAVSAGPNKLLVI